MEHEIQVDPVRGTVWVNSGFDGSCIGRFSKQFGMDVHKTATQQIRGEGECIYCTHEPGTVEDWLMFIDLMQEHYQIAISPQTLHFQNN